MDLLHSEGVHFFRLTLLSVICKVASSMAGFRNLWGKGCVPSNIVDISHFSYISLVGLDYRRRGTVTGP
jgi:hypothetical protein